MGNNLASLEVGETQTPPIEFDTALKEAQTGFYDVTFDEGFSELAVKRGLSPEDTERPAYWRAVADYTQQRAQAARERGEGVSPIHELLASTPDFIYTQALLDKHGPDRVGYQQFHELRSRASRFNSLIHQVATEHPDARASVLLNALANTANISIEQPKLRIASLNMLQPVIRGAQHEVGFGQLLKKTGRAFRPGTVQEDAHGIDYVVSARRGRVLHIDVKASLHQVAKLGGHDSAYAVDQRDGLITMYSLLTDSDLKDRFFTSERTAEEKGALLDGLLHEIEINDHALAVGQVSVAHQTGYTR